RKSLFVPLFVLLAPLLALAACERTGESRGGPVRPLIDGEHALDVLTEKKDLALPPDLGGNRFLSGWWPWKGPQGQVVLSPAAPEARLEIVSLGGEGPRTLVIDLLDGADQGGGQVRVKAAGRAVGSFPVRDPIEIPLPADLPLGRVPIDLSFDPGTHSVVAAAVRPVLPEGQVRVKGKDVVQSGDSLVDIVRPAVPNARLVGAFVPPDHPEPGQRFDLTLERDDGTPIRHFSWSPSLWNRLRGARVISLPLGDAEGLARSQLVRVRLLARGSGPAGRWERLAIAGGTVSPPPKVVAAVSATAGPPPRLVILYVMDALRADTVGYLGGPPGISPAIDNLAREGMAFYDHRSVAPNTLPSTKALFTGRPFVSRGGWKLAPEDGPTLAELFHQAGYHTGLFSGNPYVSAAYQTDRGFEHVAREVLMDGGAAAEHPNRNAAKAHTAALEWLRTLPPGSKAFLYLHTIHPHNPYDPPEPELSRWTAGIPSHIDGSTPTLTAIQRARLTPSEPDRRRLRGLYNASLAYNDAELGGFLKEVSAWAPPHDTLVAVTADHGEEHFDHGGVLHGFTLYKEMLRIPLVLWAPGRLPAQEVKARTSTLDLHTTLRQLCGLKAAAPAGPGRSLLAVAQGLDAGEDIHLAAGSSLKGGIYAAMAGRWKVIWAPRAGRGWGQGEGIGRTHDPEYLFDLEKDPGETVNLAGHGDLTAEWARSRLLAWIENEKRSEDGEAKDAPVDSETLGRLRALGYVN
ncbi:MAG TPA: sulfatase, partial [Thermoanaerobaculia bacterium]